MFRVKILKEKVYSASLEKAEINQENKVEEILIENLKIRKLILIPFFYLKVCT